MITVQCGACFRSYNLKDELAGKRIKCKDCGEIMRVPRPGEEPAVEEADEFGDDEFAAAPPPTRRSAPARKKGGAKKKKSQQSAMSPKVPLLVGLGMLGLLLVSLVIGFFVPAVGGVFSFLLIGLGGLIATGAGIWLLVVAFQESPAQGLLCLFVPFYSLFYVFTRWDTAKLPFLANVAGGVLAVGGVGVGTLAAMSGLAGMSDELDVTTTSPFDGGMFDHVDSSPTNLTSNPSNTTREPDFSVDAIGFAQQFDNERAASTEMYEGKTVRVTGTVKRGVADDGLLAIELNGTDSLTLECEFMAIFSEQVNSLRPGQSVVLQGTCFGVLEYDDDAIYIGACDGLWNP